MNKLTYKKSLEFLSSLIDYERWHHHNYEFKLENYRYFLNKIDNPQLKVKKTVLIAGTKGKGSTATMLAKLLQSQGETVGLYTSPHLCDYRERIRINGSPIKQNDFASIMDFLQPFIIKEKQRITFFETLTTIAFLFFQMQKTTVNVFEIGLGGRLDATNVTEPELSIITRIGYDHTHLLGKTLGKIAGEKCGVLRRNKQVVISYQRNAALKAIEKKIKETGAIGVYYGKDYDATLLEETIKGLKIHYSGINNDLDIRVPMLGIHQIYNISTALAAVELLKPNLNINKTQKSLEKMVMPARIQIIQNNPIIILDMSHNAESAECLRDVLDKHFSNKKRKILLIGITKEKAKNSILKALSSFFSEIYVTQADLPRAESREILYRICCKFHNKCFMTQSVESGVNHIVNIMNTHDLLVITGSVYVAGEAVKALQTRERSNI